jgi:fatty acid desaturase
MTLLDPDLSTLDARRAVEARLGAALAPLRVHDDLRRVRDLATFLGLWAVGAALTLSAPDGAWLLRAAGVGVSALALNAVVLLLHEGMHGALFRSTRLNHAASVLLGACIGMSFTAYRTLHTLHHDALGTDDDPDDYHAYTRRPGLFWLLQGVRLTVGAALYLVAIPVVATIRRPETSRAIAAEYAVMAALYAAAFAFVPLDALVWGWLIPLPVVAVMVQVRGLTQHGLTDRHDALLASRTVRPSPLVAFFLLNENYHLEHHLFPEVPSYHLPALHRLVWPLLPRAVEGRSYLAFLGRFLRASWRLDETPVGVVAPDVEARRQP